MLDEGIPSKFDPEPLGEEQSHSEDPKLCFKKPPLDGTVRMQQWGGEGLYLCHHHSYKVL